MNDKFRRLLSGLCAAAVIAASGAGFCLPAGAQISQTYSYCRVTDSSTGALISLYDYINGCTDTLLNQTTVNVPAIATTDEKLPTLIDAAVLRLISARGLTVKFTISDSYYGITYTAELSGEMLSKLGGNIPDAGLNIGLRFIYDASTGRIYSFCGQPSSDIGIKYSVRYQSWVSLLGSVDMNVNDNILCFRNDKDETFIKLMSPKSDAAFTMPAEGLFFVKDKDFVYYSSSEADAVIRDELTKVMNGGEPFTEKQLKKLDEAMSDYIEDTIEYIKNRIYEKSGSKYYAKTQIEKAVAEYFSDAEKRSVYISTLLSTGNVTDRLEGIILEYFGFDTTAANIGLIRAYIKDLVTENAVSTVNGTNIAAGEIPALIEHFIDEWTRSQVALLKTEMNRLDSSLSIKEKMDIITGNAQANLPSYSSYYNSAETMPLIASQTPAQSSGTAAQGQGFVEWVNANYGDMETFLDMLASYAASKVPAGKSAYDIAVDNGFSGTETEWLASLRGKDGGLLYADNSSTGSLFYSAASVDDSEEEVTIYDDPDSASSVSVPLPDADSDEVSAAGEDPEGPAGDEDEALAQIVDIQRPDVGMLVQPDSSQEETQTVVFPVSGDTSAPTPNTVQKADSDIPQTGNVTVITPSSDKGAPAAGIRKNPGTGVAAGLAVPAITALSVLLVKKGKRRRAKH